MEKHSGIRAVVLNEPVPAESLRRSYELKLPVYRSYGLTEMASLVAVTSPDSPPAKRSTSGRVLKYRNVKIAADGEIMVKGQTLFHGYVEGTECLAIRGQRRLVCNRRHRRAGRGRIPHRAGSQVSKRSIDERDADAGHHVDYFNSCVGI